MANEAVIIELGVNAGKCIRRTCAAGTSISGMTLMKLTDPNTVAASTAITDVWGGIASADKTSLDPSTDIGVYLDGVFDINCGDAVTAGRALALSGANIVRAAAAVDLLSGAWIGYAEETATAPNETIRVRLRGY